MNNKLKNIFLLILICILFSGCMTSQSLAEYMYRRVKFYQEYNDIKERTYVFWYIYEELQKGKRVY